MSSNYLSLQVHLLGPFRLKVDGQPVEDRRFTRRKPKQLVKLLALQSHHQLHREQLMESLWPDSDPEAASNNLHKAIHMARHALEPELKSVAESHFILTQGQLVMLRAPGGLWIDAEEFEQGAASTELSSGEEALALYEGELLAEDLYEDWAAARREQLRNAYHDLLARLANLHEQRNEIERAIGKLRTLAASDAANEKTHRQLMRLYALSGNKSQALKQYRICCEALRNDFDTEPEQATKLLYQEIISGKIVPVSSLDNSEHIETDSAIDSLAILPLVNASADPNAEYLSDGITESIINSLSQLPRLRVMARSTVFSYKGQQVDPREVGRTLGVRGVLTGRVVSRGDSLNIQTELVDVRDGSQIWGEQYRRTSTDIFELQEEIADEIAAKLRLRLSQEERTRLTKRYTTNSDAYHLYLQGRYHWMKRTDEGFQKSVKCFQQAIQIDSHYALAYVGISDYYAFRGDVGTAAIPSIEAFSKAKEAARQALALDGALAEAHTSMAHAKMHCFEWAEAEQAFQRAIELNPNYPQAHQWYAFLLLFNNRADEALASTMRAVELDPLSLTALGDLAQMFHFTGRYEQAVEVYRQILELDPHRYRAYLWLGWVYEQQGRYEDAIAAFQTSRTVDENMEALAALGCVYALSGKKTEALRVLDEIKARSGDVYVSPYQQSLLYLSLGQKAEAFEWLERAFDERAEWLTYLSVDPRFNPLRSDPRFRNILRRIGFRTS